jgi:thymidine kinase
MAKLYFYYGAMGAAKTAALLTTEYNYRERGHKTLVLTSSIDTRSGSNKVTSRLGISADAISIGQQTGIIPLIKTLTVAPYAIFVDEAQFLKMSQIDELSELVDDAGITVFCYGLRTDFKSNLFNGSKRLMELADTVTEIKTMCHCGNKATMNARIQDGKVVKEGSQIQIGGNESYIALCRRCWMKGFIK